MAISRTHHPFSILARTQSCGPFERYHYIKYSKGGEELYDMYNDPDQLNNLANKKEFDSLKEELRGWMPKINTPHFRLPKNNSE